MNESERIKLVHIIHLDGPGGGPITMSLHVSYYHKYFDITVIAGGRGVVAKTCEELHVPFLQAPIDRLWKCLWGFWVVWWHLKKIKPAVVILHGQWAGPLGAVAARLACPCRVLYICQWPSFYTDWDMFRTLRNFIAEKIPCMLVDKVIAVAESCGYQYQIRRLAEPPKLVCSTNPIDLTQTPTPDDARQIRAKHGWREDQVHVVSVGRLVDQKRVDWLLRAWIQVQAQQPEARLWIIGDGPEEENLKKLAVECGITPSVHFLGAKPNAWAYQAASDIVVMTTIYEAQGRVALEAMSCGKPIVGNDVDGVRDSFHDGIEGYLVSPADVPALSRRLCELISSPSLRRKMGDLGLERVKLFDQPRVLEKYFSIIRGYADDYNSPVNRIQRMNSQHGVFRWLTNLIDSTQPTLLFVFCFLLEGLVAWIDYILGPDIGLLLFYGLPIALVALRFGPWVGVGFSQLTACMWLMSDQASNNMNLDIRISAWNAFMRFAVFALFSGSLGSLNRTLRQRDQLIMELNQALQRSKPR